MNEFSLLCYELTLPKYNTNSTKFVPLEVCAIKKWAFMSSAWKSLFTLMPTGKGGFNISRNWTGILQVLVLHETCGCVVTPIALFVDSR
jgi:hypothetical protein